MKRTLEVSFDALASLRLAVPVMSLLGLACGVATFYEMKHGTAAAQRVFYQAPWFTLLLALLGVNIVFSLLKRWPWNRHQAGFLLAHVGILLVLAGSVVTLRAGLDGNLALGEGETDDRVALHDDALHVRLPGRSASVAVPVDFSRGGPAPGRERRFPLAGTDSVLVAEDFLPHAEVSEGGVAAAPLPDKDEDRTPAVRVRLEGPGGASAPAWVMRGESQLLPTAAGPGEVTYGRSLVTLPFRVTLLRFRSDKYPGSQMAASYESDVRVEDPERGVSEHLVSMNHPLHYRGYIFFQSSFVEGAPMTSIFSVSRSPGLPLVYTGTALISLGVLWMFYLKPWLARRQGRLAAAAHARATAGISTPAENPMRPMPIVLLLPVALCTLSSTLRADDLQPVRSLVIQDGGRLKPLDSFGRETARRVSGASPFTGGESIRHMAPAEWVLSMLANPELWRDEPMIRVTHAGLRQAIALPAGRDKFSFRELVSHQPFLAAADRVRARSDGKLDPVEQEIAGLYETLGLLSGIFTGEALHVVPPNDDPRATWLSLAELGRLEPAAREAVSAEVSALLSAEQRGDRPALGQAALALGRTLAARAPATYPAPAQVAREVRYNRAKPFLMAWLAYLAAFLLLLASFPLGSRLAALTSAAIVVLGFGLHTWGLAVRTLISGRAPVTNMYESVVFVAWGALLFALVFEAIYRSRLFLAVSLPLSVVALILADNLPILNGAIEPLVPVLRDNMWLTCHVLTITLGYAAFFLAMGLGHLNLGLYFFAGRRAGLLKTMSVFLYRAVQVGTLFLAVGTLLGGVWASYSWGRFWGWDPKETWALIALLGYLAILHGRYIGWFKDFGLAVGSILGFLLVLMAWYGVNYVLGTGLHSYGFGSGGYGYIGGFLAFEAFVLVATTLRYRALRAESGPPSLPTPAELTA